MVVLLACAVATALVGALAGEPAPHAAGTVAVFALLAVHAAVRGAAVPRHVRVLLCGGLVLLAAATLIEARRRLAAPDLSALEWSRVMADRGWQQDLYRHLTILAGCRVLACLCFVAAAALPRRAPHSDSGNPRPRHHELLIGLAAVAGLALLVDAAWDASDLARQNAPRRATVDLAVVAVRDYPGGPDYPAARATALLLAGAAMTVLGCTHLRSAGRGG
ncbi:hypothetical protein [Actinoplanes sp. DH11]|uniref:hypothetical protein n=1 Tax=Actinoplanes sp. DH11 TaxID=2857011 RepID=UPI001E2C3ED1|nr:hypothetical protein [Actinoplanes sp. DH11]